jgi:VIT1/CCC1 family predicted Fe2+/Mn2+ transporter
VSVSSQSDTEKADLARERQELADGPQAEHDELTEIYVKRGVDPITARLVAQQLMKTDPLAAHARDELGISEITYPKLESRFPRADTTQAAEPMRRLTDWTLRQKSSDTLPRIRLPEPDLARSRKRQSSTALFYRRNSNAHAFYRRPARLMAQIITRLIRPSSMHSLARQSRAICSILFQF